MFRAAARKAVERPLANIRYGLDDAYGDIRRMTNPEARDRALRVLDDRDAAAPVRRQKDEVERQIRSDRHRPADPGHRERATTATAWMKLVTEPNAPRS